MDETTTILCGSCHIAVEQRVNPDGQGMAICPTCGQSDTRENALREAGEYLVDKTMRDFASSNDMPGRHNDHKPAAEKLSFRPRRLKPLVPFLSLR